jgi:hypothetical protein
MSYLISLYSKFRKFFCSLLRQHIHFKKLRETNIPFHSIPLMLEIVMLGIIYEDLIAARNCEHEKTI